MFLALGFGPTTPVLAAQLPAPIFASSTAEDIILSYAAHYGIDGKVFLNTLRCESGFTASAKGDYVSGNPTSFGVAQIHLPAHPEVTRAEALDPLWSIDWAAHQFSLGNAYMWSCYHGSEKS